MTSCVNRGLGSVYTGLCILSCFGIVVFGLVVNRVSLAFRRSEVGCVFVFFKRSK